MKRIAAIGAALLLAACATDSAGPYGVGAIPGGSEGYRLAYVHGCLSGMHERNIDAYDAWKKDAVRFESDQEYRQGWEDGHAHCYNHPRVKYRSIGGGEPRR